MYSTLSKTILGLSILTLVSGCSTLFREPVPEVEVVTKTVEVKTPIIHPVPPRPLMLREPKWYVVSEKNLDEFLEEMEKVNGTIVFFAMNVGDYEIMAYNMQEIKRYINQMKEVVVYYQTLDVENNEETTDERPDEK
jgi:hypothetical protein